LHDWDGKILKEVGLLENNKGVISALAFSPDGSMLVAGDVSVSASPTTRHIYG
jgi:WD repeat-containing protein 1 (actin-interacting protein 1)